MYFIFDIRFAKNDHILSLKWPLGKSKMKFSGNLLPLNIFFRVESLHWLLSAVRSENIIAFKCTRQHIRIAGPIKFLE